MKPLCNHALLACVLLLAACDTGSRLDSVRDTGGESVVLAQVGDRTITRADFDRELARRAGPHPGRYISAAQHQKLLEEMIQFEVLLAGARAAGYDRDAEIQARINQFIVARFQEDRLATIARRPPTEAELRQFYAAHQDQFSVPAAARVALIQFKLSPKATAEKRDELRARAKAVWREAGAADAAAFGRLAQQHSEDQASRYLGGEIGWNTQAQLAERCNEPVSTAVFALVGTDQTTALVEIPDGFYIGRLLDQRPQLVRPFAEVREAIAYEVSQRKEVDRQAEFLAQVRESIRVKSYPDRLSVPVSTSQTPGTGPPPVPKS